MNKRLRTVTGFVAVVAVAVVVAFAAVGCGRPVGSPTASGIGRPPPTTAPAAEAVRMVLDTGAPTRFPKVDLHVHADRHDIVMRGVDFTADFSTRHVVALLGPRFPVPWPSATAIGAAVEPTLAIDTPVVPDYVVIKSYAQIEPGSLVGSPVPTTDFGCNRFTAPRCSIKRTTAGLEVLDLGREIFAGDHVVVFLVWHVPPDERRGPNAPGDAAASWLFHVSRAQPTQTSR